MAELTTPTTRVHESYVAAMAEFIAESGGDADDAGAARFGSMWRTPAGFAAFVTRLVAEAREETPRAAHLAPATTLWLLDGDEYLGRLAIRHRLTPRLQVHGGHIGYDVRPSARRRGHATAMLAAALPIARRLGIETALLTCDEDNVASRKVIEACGGVPAERLGEHLRFLVPTGGRERS